MKNTELRKLPAGSLCTIVDILETNNDWKKVMSLIPRNPRSEYYEPKYNNEHIRLIESHAKANNRKCTEILFDEWSTSGRIRPTLDTLKQVVQHAEIYRAADAIANILQEAPPQRPDKGPAAVIPTDVIPTEFLTTEQILSNLENNTKAKQTIGERPTVKMTSGNLIAFSSSSEMPHFSALDNNMSAEDMIKFSSDPSKTGQSWPAFSKIMPPTEKSIDTTSERATDSTDVSATPQQVQKPSTHFNIDSGILQDAKLIHFPYKYLEEITRRFSEKLLYTPGKLAGKIGSGGFGDVYVGLHPDHGHIAVKRAQSHLLYHRQPDIAIKVFNSEVKNLSQFRHPNIVPIIGVSIDGPALCIVCEYIDGGCLLEKLEKKLILKEMDRIKIMIGTAEGLRYLHTTGKTNDSTNTSDPQNSKKNNFIHGDVKTANILLTRHFVPKLCDFGLAKHLNDSTFVTSHPLGTQAYMAPEGFSGTITQKIDIYSYGIVLLEMLTGLKAIVINSDNDQINIKDHIEENGNDITKHLDVFIDRWTKAKEIFALAKSCIRKQRKERPNIEEICDTLYEIKSDKEQNQEQPANLPI